VRQAPESLAKDLSRKLGETQAERLPSVSAAVVHDGEVIWAEAVGLANAEDDVTATPEHQYRIGSITKTFTAAAVMQLHDEGKLDLDDRLEQHLPGVHHGTPTIRRILAHLSGLQREPYGDMWETLESPDVEQMLADLEQTEQVLDAHERHHYSNLAYSLLGEVVARRSGLSWRDYVRQRLFEPVGLARTAYEPTEPVAQGYLVAPYTETLRRELHYDSRGFAPAGQLWSTATDLCLWITVLAKGREGVLDPKTAEAMWFPQTIWDPETWTLGWGLGLMLYRRDKGIFGGHNGGMPGHVAGAYIHRERGIGAAVLVNAGAGANPDLLALQLAETALEALPEEPKQWRPQDPPPPELESALGRWWSEGNEFVFSWMDGKLEARLASLPRERPPSVFEPEGDDLFRTVSGREQGELLRLARAEDGTVIRLYWATYPFTRQQEVFGPLDRSD
jgi:CubicO group peptidase (beta-lactamase class C family)